MSFILNIGLARTGNSNIGTGTVLRELSANGFDLQAYSIHHSDTEITVVAEVTNSFSASRPVEDRVFHLATVLGQDCIAIHQPVGGHGALIGPKAAAWGEFNPEFFLLLDGSRLAAPLQVAA